MFGILPPLCLSRDVASIAQATANSLASASSSSSPAAAVQRPCEIGTLIGLNDSDPSMVQVGWSSGEVSWVPLQDLAVLPASEYDEEDQGAMDDGYRRGRRGVR